MGGAVLTAALVAVLAALLWPGAAPRAAPVDPARPGGLPPRRGVARRRGRRRPLVPAPPSSWRGSRRRVRRRRADDPWVADFAEVVAVGLDCRSRPARGGARVGPVARASWPGRRGWPLTCSDCVDAGRGVTTLLDAGRRPRSSAGAGATSPCSSPPGDWPRRWVPPPRRSRRRRPRRSGSDARRPTARRWSSPGRARRWCCCPRCRWPGRRSPPLVGMPPGRLYDSAASRVLARRRACC